MKFIKAFLAFFAAIVGTLLILDVLLHNPINSRNEAITGAILLALGLAYFWLELRKGCQGGPQ